MPKKVIKVCYLTQSPEINEDIVVLITQKNAKKSHCVVERNIDLKSEALRISFFRTCEKTVCPMISFLGSKTKTQNLF